MFTAVRQMIQNMRPRPTDEETLTKEGHREFVGGIWEVMGKLQFDFLVKQGLRPNHVFLDIACGSLRAGRLLQKLCQWAGAGLGVSTSPSIASCSLVLRISRNMLVPVR